MSEPTAKRSISLVIPMYNEEANIGHAIARAIDAFVLHGLEWEIIVVDDASTDGCASIVEAISSREPRVRLLRHEKNRKLGGTIRTGFAAVRHELVLYMDADLPFDPYEVGRAIRAMEVTHADLIAGYRFDRTTEGLKRTIYSYFYNTLIGILFGWPHRDINFSFKLATREVIEAIELEAEGSLIDAELIVKAKNLGFVIQQLGLDYFPRTKGASTLSSPTVILKIFAELWKLAPRMRRPVRRMPTPRER
ncbi:MAG: glycosyltransferase family 2 protein [Acidobacteria bacterium]|nr:glycosyltransferase family 2 protein [Acidobacteriota bacterium]